MASPLDTAVTLTAAGVVPEAEKEKVEREREKKRKNGPATD